MRPSGQTINLFLMGEQSQEDHDKSVELDNNCARAVRNIRGGQEDRVSAIRVNPSSTVTRTTARRRLQEVTRGIATEKQQTPGGGHVVSGENRSHVYATVFLPGRPGGYYFRATATTTGHSMSGRRLY